MHNYKNDFPIFKNNKDLVYLDSAATSQKPQVVIDAVREFYETYNSNIHRGLYGIAEKATEKAEDVRKKVASFINAKDSSEIVFTHGTTEGLNVLANSLYKDACGDIVLSEMEHHSNLIPWQVVAEKTKARLLFYQVDGSGSLSNILLDQEDAVVSSNNFADDIAVLDALSITHVSNVLGTINPIKKMWKKLEDEVTIAYDNFIVDAAQSVPHMPVDIQDLDCTYMVFSGHKMLAPTGVGVLYGKKGLLDDLSPLLYGSQMIESVTKEKTKLQKAPAKFEPGTMPIEAIVGLGAAIGYLTDIGMDKVREHEKRLTKYCLEQLQKTDGLTLYGPMNVEKRSGVIAFNLQGIHPHDVAQVLADDNICVRAGHHCAMPLHKRLGVEATVRVSFHIYNDEEDIEKLVRSVKKAYKLLSLQ